MDHATGGRFVVGLGAGWFEGEHEPFGIPLPPIGERDRPLTPRWRCCRRCSAGGAAAPGVTRPTRSTRCAAPSTPRRRSARRPADLPGRPEAARDRAGGAAGRGLAADRRPGWQRRVLRDRRDAILRALEAEGRDPADFEIVGQVPCGPTANSRRGRSSRAGDGGGRRQPVIWASREPAPTGSRTRRRGRAAAAERAAAPRRSGDRRPARRSGASIRRRGRPERLRRHRQRGHPGDTDSLDQIAWQTPPIPAGARFLGCSTERPSGRHRPAGSGCTRRRTSGTGWDLGDAGGARRGVGTRSMRPERRGAGGRQDRVPDGGLRGHAGRPRVPRQPRVRGDRAGEDGPAGAARAWRRRPWTRRPASAS